MKKKETHNNYIRFFCMNVFQMIGCVFELVCHATTYAFMIMMLH